MLPLCQSRTLKQSARLNSDQPIASGSWQTQLHVAALLLDPPRWRSELLLMHSSQIKAVLRCQTVQLFQQLARGTLILLLSVVSCSAITNDDRETGLHTNTALNDVRLLMAEHV